MTKNKIYFFASLMTFCFAKSVSFDVKVNAGVASISNVKTKFTNRSDLKSPEWLWHNDAVAPTLETSELLRDKNQNNDLVGGKFISKDGGNNWLEIGTDINPDVAQNEYKSYVTSVAKEYALEKDYERHHYAFTAGDATKSRSRGGFAFGLSAGVNYEVSPCVKLGATAFFTATNLKKDISYNIIPVDQNGNLAKNTLGREREVQMLLGYAQNQVAAGGAAAAVTLENTNPTLLHGITLKRAADDVKLGSSADTTRAAGAAANDSITVVFGMSMNSKGYEEIKKLTPNADGAYEVKLTTDNYGPNNGINFTKIGTTTNDEYLSNENLKNYAEALLVNDSAATAKYNLKNYALNSEKYKFEGLSTEEGADPEIEGVFTSAYAVNIQGARSIAATASSAVAANPETAADAEKPQNIGIGTGNGKIQANDVLTLPADVVAQLDEAFGAMSADFDEHYVDQTLKVKNIWGGMVTLSWNATDCTMFTLGAGIGVPSVKKIDNLKKKVGLAAMFEISTRMADSFYVGLRYQYNRINLKEKHAVANTISKVNGNFHMFSATATYSF